MILPHTPETSRVQTGKMVHMTDGFLILKFSDEFR
jgi:hypothetical protein